MNTTKINTHQTISAVLSAFIAIGSLLINDLTNFIHIIGFITIIDFVAICALYNPSPRKYSILVHHAITVALCTIYFFPHKPSLILNTNIRRLMQLEMTTPFVCIHNIFPNIITKTRRNIIWVIIRGPIILQLIYDIPYIIVSTTSCIIPTAICLVYALCVLTITWTLGKNCYMSVLLCYAGPISLSISQMNNCHMFYSYAWLIATYILYSCGNDKILKIIIYSFNIYIITQSFVISILLPIVNIHIIQNYHIYYNLSNYILISLCVIFQRYGLCFETYMISIALLVILFYMKHDGPLHLSYGNRIGWHLCECIIISNIITLK